MNIRNLLPLLLIFAVSLTRAQTVVPSLGDAARQARASKAQPPSPTADRGSLSSSATVPAQVQNVPSSEQIVLEKPYDDGKLLKDYKKSVRQLLDQGKYEQLDSMAKDLRVSKARFNGGLWKIHNFYQPLYNPSLDGSEPNEGDFTLHIKQLERWVAQRPTSITARVALAGAYLEYGGHARGEGYADTVTEEGWRLYNERAERAGRILAEASKLPEKCPEWYFQMQAVTSVLGDKQMELAAFEKAVAFDPDYYYYYRLMAEHLKPKWGGDEGELAAFASAAADRVGGDRGTSSTTRSPLL